jgi:UDP-N-acetyl-D-mannosaminuronic acid dehydrogenase
VNKKKILIFGLGYVGLPLYLILQSKNLDVIGYDIDDEKINLLKKKKFIFNEKSLSILYHKLIKNKKFRVVNEFVNSDIYIICVPTPVKKNNKFDNKYIKKCFNLIIKNLKNNDLIIIESTCEPLTTENLYSQIKKERKDLFENNMSVNIAYCPETIIPGNTLNEMKKNIKLIGGINEKSANEARKVYLKYNKNIILTSSILAELAKLSQNAYRDVNIALANEIDNICKKQDVHTLDLINLSNLHPRVNIHQPSIGVGGHCIPVDPWFLTKNYTSTNLIKTSREINDDRPKYFYKKLLNFIKKYQKDNNLKNIKIGLLGLSYKPNIDDTRESPSLKIISFFLKHKTKKILLKINDPLLGKKINITNKNLDNTELNKTIMWSDLIVLLVNHDTYKNNIKIQKMKNKIVLPDDL